MIYNANAPKSSTSLPVFPGFTHCWKRWDGLQREKAPCITSGGTICRLAGDFTTKDAGKNHSSVEHSTRETLLLYKEPPALFSYNDHALFSLFTMPVIKTTLDAANGIDQYTLINEKKTLSVMVLNYGGTLTHILVPDKDGQIRDVCVGFDDFETYKNPQNPYFGALIGRFANR